MEYMHAEAKSGRQAIKRREEFEMLYMVLQKDDKNKMNGLNSERRMGCNVSTRK